MHVEWIRALKTTPTSTSQHQVRSTSTERFVSPNALNWVMVSPLIRCIVALSCMPNSVVTSCACNPCSTTVGSAVVDPSNQVIVYDSVPCNKLLLNYKLETEFAYRQARSTMIASKTASMSINYKTHGMILKPQSGYSLALFFLPS